MKTREAYELSQANIISPVYRPGLIWYLVFSDGINSVLCLLTQTLNLGASLGTSIISRLKIVLSPTLNSEEDFPVALKLKAVED